MYNLLYSAAAVAAVASAASGNVRGSSTEYPKVPVELYYEALCPYCQDFIKGPLNDVMNMPDIVAISDFKLVPYGNTKESNGVYTCQHGPDECASDVYAMCVMYKLSGNIGSIQSGDTTEAAYPFIHCMEEKNGDPKSAEACFTSTMASSGLAWSTVDACFTQEANTVQAAGAAATVAHDYVPWVLTDGKLLQNTGTTSGLVNAICKAYTGPKPSSCRSVGAERTDVCYNK